MPLLRPNIVNRMPLTFNSLLGMQAAGLLAPRKKQLSSAAVNGLLAAQDKMQFFP
ncbi:hypothetical protein GCAAIG_02270 [Candidatus Electronema halotolerans]